MTKLKAQRSQGQSQSVDNVEDDKDTYPQHKIHPKKSRKVNLKPEVIESSDDDSDIEEIANPKESPEEELGKFKLSNRVMNSWTLTKIH